MFSKKEKVSQLNVVEMNNFSKKSIPSIIVSDLNIQGDLVSEGAIEIGGKVNGNILCDHVTIRKGADIKGNIKSKFLVINGTVNGDIISENVLITDSGKITGSIEYGYLSVESGADINCTCTRKISTDIIDNNLDEAKESEVIPRIENILDSSNTETKEDSENKIIEIKSDKKAKNKKTPKAKK